MAETADQSQWLLPRGKPPADPAPKDLEWGDDEAPAEEGKPNKVLIGEKIKKLRKYIIRMDPVRKRRCSLGTLFWAICFMLGCFLFCFGVNELDVWEIISSPFLVGISFYGITFLGGDLCLMDAFREQLLYIKKDIGWFKELNDALQRRLVGLRTVSDDLEVLSKKLGDSIQSATILLNDMHRYSMLQTVSAVVTQFFAADGDRATSLEMRNMCLFHNLIPYGHWSPTLTRNVCSRP